MKRLLIASCFVMMVCSSCITASQNYNKLNDIVPRNNALLPFEKGGVFGYLDPETLEIVIPEYYARVNQFVGGFAVVEEDTGRPYVINKNNVKVLGGFDHIALFDTEDGETVFALTGKNTDYYWHEYTRTIWTRHRREPAKIDYRLYNVNTGKMLVELGKGNYPVIDADKPLIRIFDNYITYEIGLRKNLVREVKQVYEIQNNGGIRKSEMSIDELIAKTALDNNLQYNGNDFNFYNEYQFDDWLGYFYALDIDRLFEQLPGNLGIERSEHDWRYDNDKPTLYMKLIGDIAHPLKDRFLFQVYLRTSENGGRFVSAYDGELFTGVFSASENRWEILPIKGEGSFLYGSNTDWIIYDSAFYNLRTRKKYTNTYRVFQNRYTGKNSLMVYSGYSERAKNHFVEDF